MKKITKLGVLSLALAACLTVLNANAQQTMDTKQVSLSLSGGNNTCVIDNYDFGAHDVSPVDQDLTEILHDISCIFLENAESDVYLQLADLIAAGVGTITADHFSIAISPTSKQGLIADLSSKSTTFFQNSGDQVHIYDKELNKLGAWTGSLTVDGTIPGGTPMGSYAGNLDLLIIPVI